MSRFIHEQKLTRFLWDAIKTHFIDDEMWRKYRAYLHEYETQEVCAREIASTEASMASDKSSVSSPVKLFDGEVILAMKPGYRFDDLPYVNSDEARIIGNIIIDTMRVYKKSGEFLSSEDELRKKIKLMLPNAFSSRDLYAEWKKEQTVKQKAYEQRYKLHYEPRFKMERALMKVDDLLADYRSSCSSCFCVFFKSETAEDKACVLKLEKEIKAGNDSARLKQIINDYMKTQKDPKNKLVRILRAEGFAPTTSVEMEQFTRTASTPTPLKDATINTPLLRDNLSL